MTALVAVLASGSGSNLQALLEDGRVAPHVAVVASDRAEAPALERARRRGVEALHHDFRRFVSREAGDAALAELLRDRGVEIVCLAGFMRILTPPFVRAFWPRILNVHPSLLPAFPGAHAVRDALAWGVKVTGASVHLVDEEVDHGPVVLQEAVRVRQDDDEASLHARIQAVEHRIYPEAAALLLDDRVALEGRRTLVRDAAAPRP